MILVNNFIPICGYHKVVVTEKKRTTHHQLIRLFLLLPKNIRIYVKYKTTYACGSCQYLLWKTFLSVRLTLSNVKIRSPRSFRLPMAEDSIQI